jgi:WD40 repeat protein
VINAAAFSPDGALVVTASEDKTARLLDAVTGKLIAPPLIHAGAVTAATFSPDGMRVVTASYDKTARIWPLNLDGRSLDAWKAVARCGLFVLVNGVLAINPEPLTRCESTPAEPPGRPERPELR